MTDKSQTFNKMEFPDTVHHKMKVLEESNQKNEQDILLQKTFGTTHIGVVKSLLSQVTDAHPDSSCEEDNHKIMGNISALLRGISPRDELEGMLAVQMVGIHNLTMEMMRRATSTENTVSHVDSTINRVTKLTRTFTAQMEALGKYRTGGRQSMRVEHVHVNEGGQAVIGNVAQEGGGATGGK